VSYLAYTNDFKGIMDIYMRDAARYLPLAQLTSTIMESDSELSKTQKESIALRVSTLNDCVFCTASHATILGIHGMDLTEIEAIKEGRSDDDKFQVVLEFVEQLTVSPKGLSQSDVDAVKSAGWSDQTVEDIVGIAALFALVNRLLDGLGVVGDEESYQQGAGFVASSGYSPAINMLSAQA